MPDSLMLWTPYLLAAIIAMLPGRAAIRSGVAGVTLVALAVTAASRVVDGTSAFRAINGTMLWGGMLLVGVGVALATRGRQAWSTSPVVPEPPGPRPPDKVHAFRRWGMPVLLAILLIPSAWFVLTVAGPDARSLQGLRDAPFSSAGETLLAALLLPATLVLAGIWPFGIIAGGQRFAPLAALLLIVVVVPLVGEGLEHWRSLYAGWLVLAAVMAAARARWPALLACAGLFTIACGDGSVFWAGAALTVIASLLSVRPETGGWLGRLAYLAAGACGIAALRATLGQEVVYSVLMLLAVLIGALRKPLAA